MMRKPLNVLSYAYSHHLFHEAFELQDKLPGYKAVTPSFFSTGAIKLANTFSGKAGTFLAKRSHLGLRSDVVHTYPVEHLYHIWAKIRRKDYSYFAAHDRMAKRITRDFSPPKTLIAIDTGAEALFEVWKEQTRCIYNLVIATAPYRAKVYADAEQDEENAGIEFHYPCDWELTRYTAEVSMADTILCPSEFVMDSCEFLGVPRSKLRLLPYGFDPGCFTPGGERKEGPFRIVFAGTFCFRKGSHLLMQAFERFHQKYPNTELHVFGKVVDPPKTSCDGVTFHGRISQNVFADRLREMEVMVFPTLFEGSAYVVYQSLASGVPVVTTRNCGSIVDESCGMIIPKISSSELFTAMEKCIQDRGWLADLSEAGVAKVGQYTWSHFGNRLINILNENQESN